MANLTPSEQLANAGAGDHIPADAELVRRTWALRGRLSIHAILGVLLVASAGAALVRAVQIRRAVSIGAALVGLVSIAAAGVSGARFVASMSNTASMTMAIGAGIAIGAYALILLMPPQQIITRRRVTHDRTLKP